MSEKSRSGVQVIARAARILSALKDHPNGQSLGELATTTGLARSTVQRIVGALLEEDYVVSSAAKEGLRLGPGISHLASAISANTAELCHQILFDLSKATGETADLSVYRKDKMIFVAQIPGTQRLITLSAVGEVFPMATTANGRACLAMLPRNSALELAAREFDAKGQVIDTEAFSKILDAISDSKLAYDREENNEGVIATGFAFTNWSNEMYAISVPVPSSRFERNRAEIDAAVLNARDRVLSLFSDPAVDDS